MSHRLALLPDLSSEPEAIIAAARTDLRAIANGLLKTADDLDAKFAEAAKICLQAEGRVIICALGKSGHIGRKAAATLASTGTPAFFVHASEALHGDLGMVVAGDVVILLSNSGETDEVVQVATVLQQFRVRTIGISRSSLSSLARSVDVHIKVDPGAERCPLGAAPTTSTVAVAAVLDALAVTLMRARHFSAADFAKRHPGGALGRRLNKPASISYDEASAMTPPTVRALATTTSGTLS